MAITTEVVYQLSCDNCRKEAFVRPVASEDLVPEILGAINYGWWAIHDSVLCPECRKLPPGEKP